MTPHGLADFIFFKWVRVGYTCLIHLSILFSLSFYLRIRDRTLFLSENEVRTGKAECRADLWRVQGISSCFLRCLDYISLVRWNYYF